MDDLPADGPLPYGWQVKISKKCPDAIYYFNSLTGSSTRECPVLDLPNEVSDEVNGENASEQFYPYDWLTGVMPYKTSYFPQIGDEIVYFRQGHKLYVRAVESNGIYDIHMNSQPWKKIMLRDTEVARIEDITFENHSPRLYCLKLVLLNPVSKQTDTITVKYHDMIGVIDFIVLSHNYYKAMQYDWRPGDRFRSAIEDAWWLGTIKFQKPLQLKFPDSMFKCFLAKWDNGEEVLMNPWDFEPIDIERLPDKKGGYVFITPEERQAMMYTAEPHEWSKYGRDHDCDRISRGLGRIMELDIAEPFIRPADLVLDFCDSLVEYPIDLHTIRSRVQNHYYRRLEAVKFDVRYIALNALKFNEIDSLIVKQAKCVEELCIKFIECSHCADPMIIYHEMMEAKKSRSQDSQTEPTALCSETMDTEMSKSQDSQTEPAVLRSETMDAEKSRSQDSQTEPTVLCSESHNDGDQNTPKRFKLKKTFHDWKCYIRKKARQIEVAKKATGGGPAPEDLSVLENRLLSLTGIAAAHGNKEVEESPVVYGDNIMLQDTAENTAEEVSNESSFLDIANTPSTSSQQFDLNCSQEKFSKRKISIAAAISNRLIDNQKGNIEQNARIAEAAERRANAAESEAAANIRKADALEKIADSKIRKTMAFERQQRIMYKTQQHNVRIKRAKQF